MGLCVEVLAVHLVGHGTISLCGGLGQILDAVCHCGFSCVNIELRSCRRTSHAVIHGQARDAAVEADDDQNDLSQGCYPPLYVVGSRTVAIAILWE